MTTPEELRRLASILPLADNEAGHPETARAMLEAADEIKRLENAINWALGSHGFFPARPAGGPPYWWRPELRQRAYDGGAR